MEPPGRALETVLGELEAYSPRLLRRPQLLAANKTDVVHETYLEEARGEAERRRWKFFPVSAVTGQGIPELVGCLADLVEEHRSRGRYPEVEERVVYVFDPRRERGFRVVREEGYYRVLGESVERLVERLDLNRPQALAYVQSRLRMMGVEEELLRQGAREGDTVVIGDYVFDFLPEL
jgi:GTP-binding protein